MKPETGSISFIEECTAEQFHVSELSGGEFFCEESLAGGGDGGAQATGNIHVDA